MDKKSHLSSTAICAIIKAASQAGVTELNYQDLSLKFGPVTNEIVNVEVTPEVSEPQHQIFYPSPRETVTVHPDPSIYPSEYRDEAMDFLEMVEDPVAYEDRQVKGA